MLTRAQFSFGRPGAVDTLKPRTWAASAVQLICVNRTVTLLIKLRCESEEVLVNA